MTDVLLADVDLATKAGKYVMYALAVAGGFLLGNVGTLILCRLAARLVLKRKINVSLERALRMLGGLVVAALVAFLLFRFGTGWGLGGTGSGEGEQEGGPSGETNPGKDREPPRKIDPKKEEAPIPATGIQITILRGTSFPRTFLFEGEQDGSELPAAKEKLRQRFDQSMGKLKFVDILIYRNSTAEMHPVIQEFEAFAHDLGLKTARKKLDQPLPDF